MQDDKDWLEGYKKHLMDWNEYTRRMRKVRYDQIDHDFNGGKSMVCTKCNTHWDQINAGSASWVCAVSRTMPCCSQYGQEVYDLNTNAWKCTQCGSITSTDYFYPSTRHEPKTTPIETSTGTPKHCTCSIVELMKKGCDCGGV